MRVLIVLMSGLGDVIHGLPVVNALKRADPATRVTWVVEPMPSWALRPHRAVDEVVVFDRHRGLPALRDLWRELGARRFDVAFNMNTYFKAAFPVIFSRAKLRVGIDRARTRDPVWLFNNRAVTGPVKHTQDIFLDFPRVLEIDPEPLEWHLEPTPPELEEQRAFFEPLRQDGRPIVSVVAASGNGRKDWTPEGYAAVVDALEHDLGFRTMLVGGPGEREVALARAVVEKARARPVWALGDGVRRVLWLLHGSDLVIAPDTGPLHMARALDVPVIGLFGHTSPWRVGPYRKYEDLWVNHYDDPGEAADPSRMESKLGRMETITPEEVLEKVAVASARYLRTPAMHPARSAEDRTPTSDTEMSRAVEVAPGHSGPGPGPGPGPAFDDRAADA